MKITRNVSIQSAGVFSNPICVLSPVNAKNSGSSNTTV